MFAKHLFDSINEINGWKVGQQCQVKEWAGIYEIEGFHQYGQFTDVYLAKIRKDGKGKNGKGGTTNINNLMQLDAKQPDTDKNGLTAAEYAKQIFESGYAMHDYANTTRQSLVKVLSISKTGRVKIQHIVIKSGKTPRSEVIDNQKRYSQEDYLINFATLEYDVYGDPESYTPKLYNGEWYYWHEWETIQAPSMKLTWLLD